MSKPFLPIGWSIEAVTGSLEGIGMAVYGSELNTIVIRPYKSHKGAESYDSHIVKHFKPDGTVRVLDKGEDRCKTLLQAEEVVRKKIEEIEGF